MPISGRKKAQDELFLVRDAEFELRKELLRINELNKQLELEIAALRQQQSINPIDTETFDLDKDLESSIDMEPDSGTENEPESMILQDSAENVDCEYKQSSLEELFS